MTDFYFRDARLSDVPFLVNTIIEAEKSGTDKLSYSTVFGLSEAHVSEFLTDMLYEEVDGCELSISSFLVAESGGQVVASASAWIEGMDGVSSAILKGNLLSFTLPKKCIERAISLNSVIHDLQIEYTTNSIQIGSGHVLKTFRGNNLLGLLMSKKIEILSQIRPDISEAFAQVFDHNIPSIKTCEKLNFKQILLKESLNEDILHYLPSNRKILMRKELLTK